MAMEPGRHWQGSPGIGRIEPSGADVDAPLGRVRRRRRLGFNGGQWQSVNHVLTCSLQMCPVEDEWLGAREEDDPIQSDGSWCGMTSSTGKTSKTREAQDGS
eukprot:513502-Amphidinium_carterae.1